MTVRVLPDAIAVTVTYLRANAEVQAVVGQRVFQREPKDAPSTPFVTVKRYGGIPLIAEHLDVAAIQVDVWGGTNLTNHTAARTVRAALIDMPGTHSGAVVSDVRDVLGLQTLEDERWGARHLFGVNIHLHP